MPNPYRKIRGAIRRAKRVQLSWLSIDGEYVVPLSKSTALDLVVEMEAGGDVPCLYVNGEGTATLDKGYGADDDDYEPVVNVD